MDLREQQNIFTLFLNSFRLTNRAGGAIFALILLGILLYALIFAFAWLGLPLVIAKILVMPFSLFCGAVFMRQLGIKAQNDGESFSNSCTNAALPTVYLVIYSLIMGVVAGGLAILMVASRSVPIAVIGYILFLFLQFRTIFVPAAIVLREQGPISALIYSWQLTGHRWGMTLAMCLISFLAPILVVGAAGYALYVGIPLFFADSFHLAALTAPWLVAGGVLLVLWFLFWVSLAGFYILVFLNLDYGENRGSYTPAPEVQLTDEPTQVFGADNNVLPPGIGKPVTEQDLHHQVGLQVTRASLKSAEPEAMNQHLDKVYQPPKSEDIVQYADEDRMPTILFDDEMAKQIEANQQMWAQQTKHEKTDKPDDNQTSIKMSK